VNGSRRPARPRGRGLLGSWLFTLLWLGVCTSAGISMLSKESDVMGLAMLGLFTALGLVMLVKAVRQTSLAARHQGAELRSDPPSPRGGQSVQVQLSSPRATTGRATLRLAEYRIDDSGSSPSTRLVWEQRCEASPAGGPDSPSWQARFDLPADAAANDARRNDDRVNWRIDLLDATGGAELSFDLAVQAGPGLPAEPADRWAPRAVDLSAPGPAAALALQSTPSLPEVAALHEDASGIEWRFHRRGWRFVAGCAGVAALVALSQSWHLATQQHDASGAVAHWAAGALLLAAALHSASLRWHLRVGDDGARVDRGSWMWPRLRTLQLAALAQLEVELAYTVTTGGGKVEYHRVQTAQSPGGPCRLTPGLATRVAAEGLARRLAQAATDRGTRFAPGQARGAEATGLAPGAQMLLAWLGWALLVGLAALALRG
jgi:hypothetical protein